MLHRMPCCSSRPDMGPQPRSSCVSAGAHMAHSIDLRRACACCACHARVPGTLRHVWMVCCSPCSPPHSWVWAVSWQAAACSRGSPTRQLPRLPEERAGAWARSACARPGHRHSSSAAAWTSYSWPGSCDRSRAVASPAGLEPLPLKLAKLLCIMWMQAVLGSSHQSLNYVLATCKWHVLGSALCCASLNILHSKYMDICSLVEAGPGAWHAWPPPLASRPRAHTGGMAMGIRPSGWPAAQIHWPPGSPGAMPPAFWPMQGPALPMEQARSLQAPHPWPVGCFRLGM